MRVLVACALSLLVATAQAQPEDAAKRAAEEQVARGKLETLRAQIRELTEQQRGTTGERDEATRALRTHETAIAAAIGELRALDARLGGQQEELAVLEAQRSTLTKALGTQREALAALLRSAYALGHDEELKLLLQQEDVGRIARVMAYHRYFQRARVERIDGLLADLRALADVQTAIEAKNADLNATRAEQQARVADLERERGERATLLADLETRVKDQQARLATLGKDEKGLLDLIERLRDVFADIPRQLDGSAPFASRRGAMGWPAAGRLVAGFGGRDASGRRLSGLLIGAEAGSDVRAVGHGRVAYADWLKGYGLLLIVDHGDGYMSLYGYNQALLKDVGDWVAPDESIAQAGATGGQSTPALYFELRRQGQPIDPKPWLRAR